ncbi:MAG: hypothetical protein Q7O66_09200, partial [Dehalococcoidia bacterium]|nr:hypothetical protein [Dehalococcoidia bacterium]
QRLDGNEEEERRGNQPSTFQQLLRAVAGLLSEPRTCDGSLRIYEAQQRSHPGSWEPYLLAAMLQYRCKDTDQALSAIEEGIKKATLDGPLLWYGNQIRQDRMPPSTPALKR